MLRAGIRVTIFSSAKCNLSRNIFSPEINLLNLRKIKQFNIYTLHCSLFSDETGKKYKPKVKVD